MLFSGFSSPLVVDVLVECVLFFVSEWQHAVLILGRLTCKYLFVASCCC